MGNYINKKVKLNSDMYSLDLKYLNNYTEYIIHSLCITVICNCKNCTFLFYILLFFFINYLKIFYINDDRKCGCELDFITFAQWKRLSCKIIDVFYCRM